MMSFAKAPVLYLFSVLVLSGCASTGIKSQAPVAISVAPAIDVPYRDVVKNIPDHLGVNIRWGGQILAAEDAGDKTRLTVLAYPLNSTGQPQLQSASSSAGDFVGGRFVVETDDFDAETSGRFVTVYGTVADKEILTNGKLTKTIPVVTAVEFKQWDGNDSHYAHKRYRLPYNGLGFGLRLGHTNFGYDSYGYYGYANVAPFFYPYYGYSSRYNSRRFRRSGRYYR